MFEFLFYQDTLVSYLMVAVRVSAILFAVPFFGSTVIKPHIRFVLALLIAFLVFPGVEVMPYSNLPTGILITLMLKEILVGVCIGIMSHFLFVGAQMGGQIAGIQMGFGMVNIMDPQTHTNLSIIASFLNIGMLLIFITIGGHFLVLGAISESFRFIPLGGGDISPLAFEYIVKLFTFVFLTAFKIMAPVLVTLLWFSTVMGIMGKLAPQINLMMVGFPAKITVGLFVLALSMDYFLIVFEKIMHRYFEEVANIIRMF